LNSAIDALDNKISGKLQLELYQAVEDLLLDRLVWFLRNVDLAQGLAAIVAHYREGIAAVEAALEHALPEAAAAARQGREADLRKQGVPHELARRLATLPVLVAAPDIVMVAERTGQDIAEVAAVYFAAAAFFRLDHIARAARGIVISDYFDRLALDRALDSIGDAERRLTAAMAGNGAVGLEAVEAWVAPRKAEVDRIRLAVNEIANSGPTLSKLSVAASLLGGLVKNLACVPRRTALGTPAQCRPPGAGGRFAQAGRAARACAPARHVAGARRRTRHRDGGGAHRAGHRRGRGDLFRRRGVLSSRSHRPRRARHRHFRLFRSPCARPRARFNRRRGAAAHRRDGRERRRRARGGGSLGRAAQGRGRPHPAGGERNRQFRADAVQALGGGEPVGGFGEELSMRHAPCCARN